jgi:glutathione synthase/RimK-type ligase-like ATP-grasp enzyme
METFVVVTQAGDWPLELEGARLVTAKRYLTDPAFTGLRHAKVFNLCRHYRYQSLGYYVSLIAEARGHKPVPTVLTMQDLRSPALVRIASDDLEELIQRSLASVTGDRWTLHCYFGRAANKEHDRLATALFKQFTAPFLKARFVRAEEWELDRLSAIPASAIPDDERAAALECAQAFFARRHRPTPAARPSRFDLAILWDPEDPTVPSDQRAIDRFVAAAERIDIEAEVIGREDYGRLLEFDALFLRVTTAVNHYSYRFARRAAAEGMVVIDDPLSILRCTNKVFLHELLGRNGIPLPRTRVVNRDDRATAADGVSFPCVVKQPDSSSSLGVFKADDAEALQAHLDRLFEVSDLVLVQEFLPTEFDWRIGMLDRQPLYASRYFMAPRHWQIIQHETSSGQVRYGRSETVPVDEVPGACLDVASRAANLIGDSLYGVDLKPVDGGWVVIEVNDNPSIDHGVEDTVLKDRLYQAVMDSFLRRLVKVTGAQGAGS